jgi:uncharacterized membrane protein YqjE
MLAAVQVLFLGFALLSLLGLVLGLIRPVLVLWFLDRFNRLKVIQVYGVLFLIFALLSLVLNFFSQQ